MKGDCNASQQNSSCCPRPAAVGHLTLSSSTIYSVLRARPLADYRDHHSNADMHFLLQPLPGQMTPPLAAVLHSDSKLLSKISCGEGQGSSLILQIGASGCNFTNERYSYDSRTPVFEATPLSRTSLIEPRFVKPARLNDTVGPGKLAKVQNIPQYLRCALGMHTVFCAGSIG